MARPMAAVAPGRRRPTAGAVVTHGGRGVVGRADFPFHRASSTARQSSAFLGQTAICGAAADISSAGVRFPPALLAAPAEHVLQVADHLGGAKIASTGGNMVVTCSG